MSAAGQTGSGSEQAGYMWLSFRVAVPVNVDSMFVRAGQPNWLKLFRSRL